MGKFVLLLMLLSSTAQAGKTFMLEGSNGACTVIDSGREDVSILYCAQTFQRSMIHFVKIDFFGKQIPHTERDRVIVEHEDTHNKVRLGFEQYHIDKANNLTSYLWVVPEMFLKLFKEEVKAKFEFHLGKTKVRKTLTADEKERFRFISLFESITRKSR